YKEVKFKNWKRTIKFKKFYGRFRKFVLRINKISCKRIILSVYQRFNRIVKLTVQTVCFIIKSRC
ncbi:MAG: hypothetical protein ACLTA9_13215, partial [Clostridium saudiense]